MSSPSSTQVRWPTEQLLFLLPGTVSASPLKFGSEFTAQYHIRLMSYVSCLPPLVSKRQTNEVKLTPY